MSISNEEIKRINELYHKDKSVGLNEVEKIEQKKLREKYIKSIRENLRSQLNNVDILEKDGSITSLNKKYNEKKD